MFEICVKQGNSRPRVIETNIKTKAEAIEKKYAYYLAFDITTKVFFREYNNKLGI